MKKKPIAFPLLRENQKLQKIIIIQGFGLDFPMSGDYKLT